MEADRSKAKVLVVGDRGVGKRSLVRRTAIDPIDDRYVDMMGAKVSKKEIVLPVRLRDGTYIDLILWTVQDPALRGRGRTFAHGCSGVVAVCDATRRDTLDHLRDFARIVTEVSGRIPMVIAANKWDLVGGREIGEADIRGLAEPHEADWFLTSAVTGQNVDPVFQALAERIVEFRRGSPGSESRKR
ncbi:MAG TPA: Rab family GTPase [Thermoplasmata archaeon]|nr:Rab family GTPase [Thermoplasmata archaeon]